MPSSPARTTIRPGRPPTDEPSLDDGLTAFERLRPRLLGIAYRILGNRTEADDIVQDAWVRWQTYDRTRVLNATAFLVTTTTRLAVNVAQSARVRRESYVGRGLPEPVDTDDPTSGVERNEALEVGILLLMQRLTPTERAAYVLRHAFDYPYPQIAQVLQTSETNARQLVSRASKHLVSAPHRSANRSEQHRLVHAFVAASRRGEVAVLERLFAAPQRCHTTRRCSVL